MKIQQIILFLRFYSRIFHFFTFSKPWMQAATMSAGEFTCLFVFFVFKLVAKADVKDLATSRKQKIIETLKYWKAFLLLAALDVIATSFSQIGLMMVPSSVYQMFKCLTVVFASIWAKVFFKRVFGWVRLAGLLFVWILYTFNYSSIFRRSVWVLFLLVSLGSWVPILRMILRLVSLYSVLE